MQSETNKFVSFVLCRFTKGAAMKNITSCKIIRSFFGLKMPSDITVHQLQQRDVSINILL